MKKNKALILGLSALALAMGVGAGTFGALSSASSLSRVNAASPYAITFLTSGSTNDGSTAIKTLSDIVASGDSYISSVALSNVYLGKDGTGMKLGSSKSKGSATFTWNSSSYSVKPTSIVVSAMAYDSNVTMAVSANGSTATSFSLAEDDFTDYTYEMNGSTDLASFTVAATTASKQRFYVKSVTVYYAGATPTSSSSSSSSESSSGSSSESSASNKDSSESVAPTPVSNTIVQAYTFADNAYGLSSTAGNQTLPGDYPIALGEAKYLSMQSPTEKVLNLGYTSSYIKNTTAPSDYYISSVAWTYSTRTNTSGVISGAFGATALSSLSSGTSAGSSITAVRSGSGRIENTNPQFGYFYLSNATANAQFASLTVTWTKFSDDMIPTALTMDPSSASIAVNGTATLAVTATPETASNAVTWSSSNTSVATVDSNGKVTGLDKGTATITATSVLDKTIKATCAVTVTADPTLSLDKTSLSAYTGDAAGSLTASAKWFDNAVTYSWESSNPEVASVSGTSATTTVTYGKAGSAKITLTAKDSVTTKTAECTVTVAQSSVTSVAISGITENEEIELGKSPKATAAVTGVGNFSQDVAWSSSNEAVATVENGTLTLIKTGTTKITAKSVSDETKYDEVTIRVIRSTNGGTVAITTDDIPAAYGDPFPATDNGAKLAGEQVVAASGKMQLKKTNNGDVIAFLYNTESFGNIKTLVINKIGTYAYKPSIYTCAAPGAKGTLVTPTEVNDNGYNFIYDMGGAKYFYIENQNGNASSWVSITLNLALADTAAVAYFIEDYMHMDANVEGQCNTYYSDAKTAFNALTADQRALMASNASYADAWARLQAWVASHGDHFDANKSIVSAGSDANVIASLEQNQAGLLLAFLGLATIGGFAFFACRTKKSHR